ncbi:MAG: hypothetical protein R3199_02080 [Gemmatimonadota bacterium]|nr:hypothetical protein [Gemmatimonadota bacterium]
MSATPGGLAERIARLPLVVEGHRVETGSVPAVGYYGGEPRPTGVIVLEGEDHEGAGENVGWTPEAQDAFAGACGALVPHGETTVGELSAGLSEATGEPYHRAAVEAAAIDLALKRADTNLFRLAGRDPLPVRFCWSIHEGEDPVRTVEALLASCPTARAKLDVPEEGWPDRVWEALGATGRIVVADFKRKGVPRQVLAAHRHLPEAWLEDPPLETGRDGAASAATAHPVGGVPGWLDRISLDGWVRSAEDLRRPPLPPAAINVKAPRVGGWLEALRILERCRRRGWAAYVGGMFEVGIGRWQARTLASLFSASAWNDLAPVREEEASPFAATPLPMSVVRPGFGRAEPGPGETGSPPGA